MHTKHLAVRRSAALLLAAAAVLATLTTVPAAPAAADAPDLRSGFGITVQRTQPLAGSSRTLVVDIATSAIDPRAVNGPHQVRITLPSDYVQRPTARYPVLYLLHGGAGGRSSQWSSDGGAAEALTAGRPIITVMPDGGKVGWFTNWRNQSAGAQAWETFHLTQLIPWVDANLRTLAAKQGRAIAGLSMGGFGAIHYAQQRPDLFAAVASFSGALDLEDQAIRATIVQQTLANGLPVDGPFGWPIFGLDGAWIANNPLRRADRLRGVQISMYAGSGIHDADVIERTVGWSSFQMHNALDAAGVPNLFVMYGRPGPGVPFGCDGGHNFGCWNYALSLALPRMLEVLARP
jgi:S-formylglutathione hydrolase FrmB